MACRLAHSQALMPAQIVDAITSSAAFRDAARAAGINRHEGMACPMRTGRDDYHDLTMSREHGTYWGAP